MYTNCALTVKQLFYKPKEGEVGGGRRGKVDGVGGCWRGLGELQLFTRLSWMASVSAAVSASLGSNYL